MTEEIRSVHDLRERIDGNRFAMVTSIDERGTLSSRPVTIQRFDDVGDLWFLVNKDADWVQPANGSPVNASVSDSDTWVSFAGVASVVDEPSTIESLMDPMSDSYFGDGDEPVALRIVTDRIEWWASANKAVQLFELVKSKVTGEQADTGSSGTLEV